jgi:peptide/nickel transport system permease protein
VLRFIAYRLLMAVVVLFGLTIVTFLIIHLIPGNPAQTLLFGSNPTPAQIQHLEVELGLDKPLYVQYGIYLWNLLHGNMGTSFLSNQSVTSELLSRAPSTLILSLSAIIFAVLVGVPLGIIGGVSPGSPQDAIARFVSFTGTSIPYFWLALILVLIFAVHLNWLPAIDNGTFKALILPSIALGWAYAAVLTRLIRGRLIDVYHSEYIRNAQAKGCTPFHVLVHHALRNAAIPAITVLGLQVGNILTGAAVIEVIFARAGLGSYMVSAINSKDIPVVQASVLFVGTAYVIINLIVDLFVGVIDPRTRLPASG